MVNWTDVVKLGLQYPGIFEAVSYGEPSLKLRKKLVTRLRQNDNSIVLMDIDPFERDRLLATKPEVYYLEPHYEGYDIVLAKLSTIDIDSVEMFIERR